MTRVLLLFDVDGTLTPSRLPITAEMQTWLSSISSQVDLAVVGGSDMNKITEQLTAPCKRHSVMPTFKYVFSENGTVAYKEGVQLRKESIAQLLGEEKLKEVINFALRYIADLDIPVKRGTFVEYRNGMLNFSPIGRACSQQEREEFFRYDLEHNIRTEFRQQLEDHFSKYNLQFAIGGQISVDCFPKGWDKTHCLPLLEEYPVIHFFGDRTKPVSATQGENDYDIYICPRVIGHSVTGPEDTRKQVEEVLAQLSS